MTDDTPDLNEVLATLELTQEALTDAERILAYDDRGWSAIGGKNQELYNGSTEAARTFRHIARVAMVRDPLISRGITLRASYVWGEGVTISGTVEGDDTQDLAGFVSRFIEDNANTWSSMRERELQERALATDGNLFFALPTSPLTGRVTVRQVEADEITDILTDPDDSATPWFYRRRWSQREISPDGIATNTRTVEREAFYPDVSYRPPSRPRSIDGIEVVWSTPIAHCAAATLGSSRWGVPDVLASLEWARMYAGQLGDFAGLVKALSRFAFKATTKTRAGAANVREKMTAVDADGKVGQTVVTAENAKFEAIGKSGATIDSNSGRPIAAMVAAGLDIPVTMLLADPGVTGARATAETLDRPMELVFMMRRALHADTIQTIVYHAIREAVRAPRGPLRGTVTRDPDSGREFVTLQGDQVWGVDVDWPDLSTDPTKDVIAAVVDAHAQGLVDPLVAARLVAVALGVDDVEAAVSALTDDDGNFVAPGSQPDIGTTAALAAASALQAGVAPNTFL